MEKLQVWLDDVREMPSYKFDVWVKTAHEAMELIKTNTVEFISLDYQLDEHPGVMTGLDVAEFIRDEYKAGNIDFVMFHPHTSSEYMFEQILKVKREHLANHKQKLENNA